MVQLVVLIKARLPSDVSLARGARVSQRGPQVDALAERGKATRPEEALQV